jgi:acetyl esterase/lipase
VRWLEAVLEPAATNPHRPRTAPVIMQLPGGARLELADVQQVALAAALLRALEHPATPC